MDVIKQAQLTKLRVWCRRVKIASLSPHPFKLSNGDTLPAQSKEVVDFFTLNRNTTSVYVHSINKLGMIDDRQVVFT